MPITRYLISLHLAVLLFGLSGLFVRITQLSAVQLVIGRTFFAVLVLVALRHWFESSNNRLLIFDYRLILTGALLAGHWFSFFYAIELSTVAFGVLTFASFPLFVAVFEIVVAGHRYRISQWLALLLVVVGLLLLVRPESLGNASMIAWYAGLLSGLTFAVLTLLNRSLLKHYSAITLTLHQNGWACLVLLPWLVFQWSAPSLTQWFALLVLGVFCTAIAHALFIFSLQTVRAYYASLVAGLEPIYGIAFALIFFAEWPSWLTILGGACILLGVLISQILLQRSSYQAD